MMQTMMSLPARTYRWAALALLGLVSLTSASATPPAFQAATASTPAIISTPAASFEELSADQLMTPNREGVWFDGGQYARAHYPWMGAIFVWNLNFQSVVPQTDEKWGFGIMRPDLTARPAYSALAAWLRS